MSHLRLLECRQFDFRALLLDDSEEDLNPGLSCRITDSFLLSLRVCFLSTSVVEDSLTENGSAIDSFS